MVSIILSSFFQTVNSHCFPAFLAIPPPQFKLVLDSIIWAFKHTMRNVADTGLQILYQMLQNISANEAAAQAFYQTYFTDILQHIFSVVTDTSHTAGLGMHATILAYLFTIVEIGKVTVPLNPSPPMPFEPAHNVVYVQVRFGYKFCFGNMSTRFLINFCGYRNTLLTF